MKNKNYDFLSFLFRKIISFKNDLRIEKSRFDIRAKSINKKNINFKNKILSSFLVYPYKEYEKKIKELSNDNFFALELCSGMGENTEVLLECCKSVYATDISPNSLKVLAKNFKGFSNCLKTKVCNMEDLPFENENFDIITCAGGLSYGNNLKVKKEIFRLLKKGGVFICIDSLDENPIYKLNRIFHFIKQNRTLSTLFRMPNFRLIKDYKNTFDSSEVIYFGSFTWIMPLVKLIFNDQFATKLSKKMDKCSPDWMSFKFLLVCKKI